jgi:hypothetical protein
LSLWEITNDSDEETVRLLYVPNDNYSKEDIAINVDYSRFKDLVDFITRLAQPPKDEWIRVEDRLPDKEQEVIVYFRNEIGWHTTAAYWDGYFMDLCEVCGNREGYAYKTITHWMPLPTSPIK